MLAVLNNAHSQFRDVEGVAPSTVESLAELQEGLRQYSRELVRAMGAQTPEQGSSHIGASQSLYNSFLNGVIALGRGKPITPTLPAARELDLLA